MNTNRIDSIVNPTILQAKRLPEGRFSAAVALENKSGAGFGYVSLEDYSAHHANGFITIHSIQMHGLSRCTVTYSVN